VRRLTIKHDRDHLVIGDNHWNLMMIDTSDPHEQPALVGYGSFETCRSTAAGLVDLARKTGLRP